MTTRVTVAATHGWPVKVTKIYTNGTKEICTVPADKTEDFYVWDGMDILVHEIQPKET